MTVEFHRPVPIGQIRGEPIQIDIEATEAECRALAMRMDVPAIRSLRCSFKLSRESNSVVRAEGRLHADLVQTCIVSLDDFGTEIAESFAVRFVPSGEESDDIDPDMDDEVPYADGVLDLGEAAAEQLGLAIDP